MVFASSSAQQFRGREAPARLYHAGGAKPACVRPAARAIAAADRPVQAPEPGQRVFGAIV